MHVPCDMLSPKDDFRLDPLKVNHLVVGVGALVYLPFNVLSDLRTLVIRSV